MKRAKSYQDPESYREIETGEIEDQENYSSSVKEIQKPPEKQAFDPKADFLGFDSIKPKISIPKTLEEQMNDKYDRQENCPWISDETLRNRDINVFLHNEILDYIKWLEPSQEDKDGR